MHDSTDFVLHGGDTAFASRQKLLFDKLSVAEKECSKTKIGKMDVEVEDVETEQQPRGVKRKSETKRFRGKESIFKRPEGPAPRCHPRNIPDYRRNPHKWVKYSLDDVSNDDMTDRSNTQAALSFLKELKARRSRETEDDDKMDIDVKVAFKPRTIKKSSEVEFRKPANSGRERNLEPEVVDHDDNPMFRGSKIIMPEYVVGQKQRKKTRKEKCAVKIESRKQLKLDHLQELDEDED